MSSAARGGLYGMITSVATVRLRGPLKRMAGERGELAVEGATVGELLRALERDHPALAGWILDERGHVRRHINVYVAGEPSAEATPVGAGDAVDVLPAISGGAR
jgi:molybdopterin synthase sulfur carrier subunit